MKGKILITLLSALALAESCSRTQPDYVFEQIKYAFSTPSTKVISAEEFVGEGNKMSVYDVFVDGNDKTVNYIDGVSVTSPGDGGIWTYDNGKKYYWIEGTHNFWGYSTYYKTNGSSFEGFFNPASSCNMAEKTLTIESTTLRLDSPQFDFVYSKPEVRVIDKSISNTAPVELECNHLFSAIGITAVNKLPHSTVTIKKIYFKNLKNTNSATVNFGRSTDQVSLGTPTVTYIDATKRSSFASVEPNLTLQSATAENKANECADIFNTASTVNGFYLVWPQDNLTPHPTEGEDGEITYDPDDTLICVEYSINDGMTLTREVPFPTVKNSQGISETIKLVAGKKHLITINFVNKMLELNCQVLPWDYEESVLDYTDATAQADPIYIDPVTTKRTFLFYDTDRLSDDGSGNLIIDPSKGKANVNDEAKTVTMILGRPVTARFRLNSPQGAEWMVDLVGPDRREFNVVKETSNLIDGTNCNFRIEPKNTSPTKDLRVNVRITLRLADGRTASVDEILQGGENLSDQYTIIQPIAH